MAGPVAASAGPADGAPRQRLPIAWVARALHWLLGFGCLVGWPGLHTVGDLVVLRRTLTRHMVAGFVRGRDPGRLPPLLLAIFGPAAAVPAVGLWPDLRDPASRLWSPRGGRGGPMELLQVLDAAYFALPAAWVREAEALLPPATQEQRYLSLQPFDMTSAAEAMDVVAGRLGWQGYSVCVPPPAAELAPLTVKAATTLQLGPRLRAQRAARADYVACALAVGAAPAPEAEVQSAQRALEAAMKQLWQLPWDNDRKEVLWRLTVNGVRGAGGHDIALPGPCGCGWAGPSPGDAGCRARQWRLHHFWGCPVAEAVRKELSAALGAARGSLTCAHVWLLRPPPDVCPWVWPVVCAAALEAMERGRKVLWAAAADDLPDGQTHIEDFFPPVARPAGADELPRPGVGAPITAVVRAQRRAAAWFWCIIQDFVSLHKTSDLWGWAVPSDHPFMGHHGTQLELHLSPGLMLPRSL